MIEYQLTKSQVFNRVKDADIAITNKLFKNEYLKKMKKLNYFNSINCTNIIDLMYCKKLGINVSNIKIMLMTKEHALTIIYLTKKICLVNDDIAAILKENLELFE